MAVHTVTLNNGKKCPVIGLGTFLSAPGECAQATKDAIDAGYRHIDAAFAYGNEKEVGEGVRNAIREGTVTREDLFITTKLWCTSHEKKDVFPALKKSLENLGLEYVDLYLIHWPVACNEDGTCYEHDLCETWKGMEACVDLGLAESIGVSNFNSKQVQKILDKARIKPVMNQIELSPLINQKKLTAFCKERGIQVTGYSPFGSPARPWKKPDEPVLNLDDPKLIKIGKIYGKSSSQVILRYLIQLGVVTVPKSSNPERIKQNIDIFDFQLSPDDVKVLDRYNCNFRVVTGEDFKESSDYPFNEIF